MPAAVGPPLSWKAQRGPVPEPPGGQTDARGQRRDRAGARRRARRTGRWAHRSRGPAARGRSCSRPRPGRRSTGSGPGWSFAGPAPLLTATPSAPARGRLRGADDRRDGVRVATGGERAVVAGGEGEQALGLAARLDAGSTLPMWAVWLAGAAAGSMSAAMIASTASEGGTPLRAGPGGAARLHCALLCDGPPAHPKPSPAGTPRGRSAARYRPAHAHPCRRPRGVRQAARRRRRSSSTAPAAARCSCASRPAASATPTSTRPAASTRPATRRPCSATRAPGVVEAIGEGVTSLAPGDHVVTLFSPQCGECMHCRSPKTNLCLAIREQQNLGYLPDGTTRLHRDGERIRHFMGTSTFAEATVMPEIALAKVDPGGAAGRRLHAGLRRDDRHRRGAVHRQGRARLDLRGLRRRAGRPRRRRRRAAGRGRADHLRRPRRRAARGGARARRHRPRPRRRRTRSPRSSR